MSEQGFLSLTGRNSFDRSERALLILIAGGTSMSSPIGQDKCQLR